MQNSPQQYLPSQEPSPELQEQRHKNQVKTSFVRYSQDIRTENPSLFDSQNIHPFYKPNKQRKAMMMQQALKHNQHFLSEIINYINTVEEQQFTPFQVTTPSNKSKINTTLKQCFREWCSESQEQKDYFRLVKKCSQFVLKGGNVLVPGCGLGRLVFELVRAGFGAEGNEVTYFMIFASNFIINAATRKEQFKIYPFINSSDYYYDQQDVFRSILIPDIAPVEEMQNLSKPQPQFAIAGGQFVDVYGQRPLNFQGVVTCFFIDTANNVFHYIDTIHCTLKSKGVWVNFGPLLFHYRQMQQQVSIEVSWSVLKSYIEQRFDLVQEEMLETTYCHDPKSQLSVVYNCISFVAIKKQ